VRSPASLFLPGLVLAALAAGAGPATAGDIRSDNRIEGGTWLAEDIQSRGAMDYLQTTLQVTSGGGVSGFGGCNRYFGDAEIDGDKIRFGALGATRMACPAAVMDQESRFLAALELVRRWRVEPTGLLHLLDEDGVTVVRFSRQS